MHTQNDMVETRTQLQQFIGSTVMDLPGTVTRHCLILEDATGKEHKIPMEFCMSLRVRLSNVLGKISYRILSSNSIACLESCLNATRIKLAFKDGISKKDSTTCASIRGRKLLN